MKLIIEEHHYKNNSRIAVAIRDSKGSLIRIVNSYPHAHYFVAGIEWATGEKVETKIARIDHETNN
jgi:hypothetical protein